MAPQNQSMRVQEIRLPPLIPNGVRMPLFNGRNIYKPNTATASSMSVDDLLFKTRPRRTIHDWSAGGIDGHRSTKHGYANPEIQDAVAEEAVRIIEGWRSEWDIPTDGVFICGVDNSTTALGMATIRLRHSQAGESDCYRFCSGKRDSDVHDDVTDGALSLYYRGTHTPLFVLIDDDMCKGKGLGTIAKRAPDNARVCWIGIYQHIKNYYYSERVPKWLDRVDDLQHLLTPGHRQPGGHTGKEIAEYLHNRNKDWK